MSNQIQVRKWFIAGLLSLVIVALYGTLMRYKIAFNFPFFKQKFLLHAHSHFAFSGWITHTLYLGLIVILQRKIENISFNKYKILILLNLLVSYGMLVSFTMQGYELTSIILSTLTIVITIVFTVFFISDSKHLKNHPSRPWAIMGLFMSILSALGPFYMAYMIMNKDINFHSYLGSLYYFLHFQYNGWFFFGSMAILSALLPADSPLNLRKYFPVFAVTIIPTVFLSLLWAKLPLWLYIITIIATMAELIAWFCIIKDVLKIKRSAYTTRPKWVDYLFYVIGFALTVKFILQAVSIVPSLSDLVFGIRSIVIAYLHLILLGIYSTFILAVGFYTGYLEPNRLAKIATFSFITGIVLNELFLGTHGFAAFFYKTVPYMNELLLFVALILFISSLFIFLSQITRAQHQAKDNLIR